MWIAKYSIVKFQFKSSFLSHLWIILFYPNFCWWILLLTETNDKLKRKSFGSRRVKERNDLSAFWTHFWFLWQIFGRSTRGSLLGWLLTQLTTFYVCEGPKNFWRSNNEIGQTLFRFKSDFTTRFWQQTNMSCRVCVHFNCPVGVCITCKVRGLLLERKTKQLEKVK